MLRRAAAGRPPRRSPRPRLAARAMDVMRVGPPKLTKVCYTVVSCSLNQSSVVQHRPLCKWRLLTLQTVVAQMWPGHALACSALRLCVCFGDARGDICSLQPMTTSTWCTTTSTRSTSR
jgi:hypothetical protein